MSIIKIQSSIEAAAADGSPMLTPAEALEQLRGLRGRIPEFVQLPKKVRRAARVRLEFAREAFSAVGASPLIQEVVGNTPDELLQADAELAQWTAVESEIHALLRGVADANLVRRQRIGRAAVHAYNLTRELSRQDDHADLLPYVERMRRLPRYGRRRKPADPQPPPPPPQVDAV